MTTNSPKPLDDQEIDLSLITKKISGFFDQIATFFFNCILYVQKNKIILALLFIIGVAGGVLLDSTSKSYDHNIVVTPNFNSVEYLYGKIDLLNSKIKEDDTIFLKSIGIKEPKKLALIEIEPIIDIYTFVSNKTNSVDNAQNSQNFELVKLLSEDGDIKKVIKDELTSKNYAQHLIHIATKGFATNENLINPIMDYLNQSEYYEKMRKTYIDNILFKLKKNEEVIAQIDGLLNSFSSTAAASNQKSDKLVYYNENTQINDVISTKNNLGFEIGSQKLELLWFDKIIKEKSRLINLKNTKKLNDKLKFVLPIFLIFSYVSWGIFMSFYRKQKQKALQK